jgi:hypothetical protein
VARLSNKKELSHLIKYAEGLGRPHDPLAPDDLDFYFEDAEGGCVYEVRQGDSSGYYVPRGDPGAWEWALISVGPHGLGSGIPVKEWFVGQPKFDEPNPNRIAAIRFYKEGYGESVVEISCEIEEGDYAFRYDNGSTGPVTLALITEASGGIPVKILPGKTKEQEEVGSDTTWRKLIKRQRGCAELFNLGQIKFNSDLQFKRSAGMREYIIRRREDAPLTENQTPYEIGQFACGHLKGDPAGSTRLVKIHSVTAHGRARTLEMTDGTVEDSSVFRKLRLQTRNTAKLQAEFEKRGFYAHGFAFMRAMRDCNRKSAPRKKNARTQASQADKPFDYLFKMPKGEAERCNEVRKAVIAAARAAGAPSTLVQEEFDRAKNAGFSDEIADMIARKTIEDQVYIKNDKKDLTAS